MKKSRVFDSPQSNRFRVIHYRCTPLLQRQRYFFLLVCVFQRTKGRTLHCNTKTKMQRAMTLINRSGAASAPPCSSRRDEALPVGEAAQPKTDSTTSHSPLEEMDIFELQGTLSVPDHLRQQQADDSSSSSEVFLGTVERQGGKKVTLNIGTLVVEGEINPYKKKMLILQRVDREPQVCASTSSTSENRKRCREEDIHGEEEDPNKLDYPSEPMLLGEWLSLGDNEERVARAAQAAIIAAAESTSKREYKVVGVATNHYLFKSKPSRVFK